MSEAMAGGCSADANLKQWENKEPGMTGFVQQRSNYDCGIAAFATVAGTTYEDAAALLGWPCDVVTGLSSKPDYVGISFIEMAAPLWSLGFASTTFVSSATAARMGAPAHAALPQATMREWIRDRPAILMTWDTAASTLPPVLHALAWVDNRLIDCRGDRVATVPLDQLEILAVLILSRPDKTI